MRLITHDGIHWTVHELDASATPGSKAPRCLVFDGDTIVRRVWLYPGHWRELSDDALGALLDAVVVASPSIAMPARRTHADCSPVESAQHCAERTRALLAEMAVLRDANRALRADREVHLAECRRFRVEMRAAVETYASALRASGVPPERALVLLKSAMHDGIADMPEPDDQERDAIVRDGVAWGIEAYFAA